MPRFFIARSPLACGDIFALPENINRHIKVLRLKNGTRVTLFNGNGKEYRAELMVHDKRHIDAHILSDSLSERESPLDITLIQAISTGERMDFTIQKCVELGVNTIQPVQAAHNNVRLDKERAARRVARWQEIAIAACEQCGRNHIPQILPLLELSEVLYTPPFADTHLLLSPAATTRLRDITPSPKKICLLAGSEGGLTAKEEELAIAAGFTPLQLGPRVLRTETAAVATIAALQALWGDM